ncbi:MAG TPA: NUDIX domain-containing protein [Candidatus Limnocylindrales bacterium]|nr:NUDIX domain-containing protein [Candidatus Limnocylindrales bacterium]
MSLRPDLVECWIFRVPPSASPGDARTDAERLEILLVRRAAHRIFPGLWQCVTGGVEKGELVPAAAMREVREETGLGPDEIEAFYDLDQVAPFYDEGTDAVVVSAIFAARVRPDAEAHESWEHDGLRWVPAADAPGLAIWPSYGESVRRVREMLLDASLEPWFRLDPDGRRIARRPTA